MVTGSVRLPRRWNDLENEHSAAHPTIGDDRIRQRLRDRGSRVGCDARRHPLDRCDRPDPLAAPRLSCGRRSEHLDRARERAPRDRRRLGAVVSRCGARRSSRRRPQRPAAADARGASHSSRRARRSRVVEPGRSRPRRRPHDRSARAAHRQGSGAESPRGRSRRADALAAAAAAPARACSRARPDAATGSASSAPGSRADRRAPSEAESPCGRSDLIYKTTPWLGQSKAELQNGTFSG